MSTSSLKYTSKLANQRVLILGGSSGIGFAVAEASIEYGAQVILSSSSQSKLDNAVARLQAAYPTQTSTNPLKTHVCDLSDAANLDANIESLLQAATNNGTHKLNHVVTTAGDALKIPALKEIDAQKIYSGMNVRLVAPAVMVKYLPKYMDSSPSNSFTLTSGVRSRKPAKGWSIMTAVASGIEGLARGLALELAPVRVNTVSPGAVNTEIFSFVPKEALDGVLQNFRDQSTTGTVGRPEDLAESYIYAMRDQFVTGSIIESNGGILLK
ncbi:NAD(P)-binding protein [Penicillium verhagenii]|uniref:NAD(P)-binding protein n=1 Tax=Penicillium verhagenii TaxID=1562060 RepID=UPI0025452652|nr:NAD(P)-binding protein [Penicillium verhagenii]KAJ5928512.1 NAD(P)-binding protein [Penicillium verhagenii]